MATLPKPSLKTVLMGGSLILLTACETNFDMDLRRFGGGFDTSSAARAATPPRPEPDGRGIISYPNYQVAVARRGDTVSTLASRIGLPAAELARFNGLPADAPLRDGELVALPRRVAEPSSGVIRPADEIDITTLAGDAIDRAGTDGTARRNDGPTGEEPLRHQVARGETAYSIARLNGVSVRALADWNGLDTALTVREGQYLLIPPVSEAPRREARVTEPGEGSPTPTPPSAAAPLPDESPAAAADTSAPDSPELGESRTSASAARMAMPVDGRITRPFEKGRTDGIDIAASAGSSVRAAANGTVAAITRDTDQVPILVVRHPNNVLTVYANIDGIAVEKGDRVKRGDKLAEVRAGSPAFLHFQVREGTTSVDPLPYLN